MPLRRVRRISLRDFRSYAALDLAVTAGAVVLYGPNGAGKTNLLEALSLLGPGRGLRRAAVPDLVRQGGRGGWGIGAGIGDEDDEASLSLRADPPVPLRKVAQIDGQKVSSSGAFSDHIRFQWLTPAQGRLFLDAPGDRRRFLDRMVLTGDAAHGSRAMAYEKATRQRQAVLAERWDTGLLQVLEAQMAEHGVQMILARHRMVEALAAGYAEIRTGAFPGARLSILGRYDEAAATGSSAEDLRVQLAEDLARGRRRDAEAGRALTGPHRSDLEVIHTGKEQPARLCSTGEQKALLVGLVLAHAAALMAREEVPLGLLLDEISAHLDADRRAALADILTALRVQAFMTGTDREPFDAWAGRAQLVEITEAAATPREW